MWWWATSLKRWIIDDDDDDDDDLDSGRLSVSVTHYEMMTMTMTMMMMMKLMTVSIPEDLRPLRHVVDSGFSHKADEIRRNVTADDVQHLLPVTRTHQTSTNTLNTLYVIFTINDTRNKNFIVISQQNGHNKSQCQWQKDRKSDQPWCWRERVFREGQRASSPQAKLGSLGECCKLPQRGVPTSVITVPERH